ncbi:MFS transporter [Lentilactobacillus raoultii]|uniref:MFS transporter n=1 Tax=Lentilactobacillus raoultii TaxID=1987503 RepID=A0ABW3PEK3_9LACO|nr:MFS transporter [Lentilactobacillus raoultii]
MNKTKYVLPILLLGNLLCMMDVSIMTIVLPEIQTAFKVNLTDLSWTLNVYTIVFASLIIPFGRFAQKIGRNKFVFIGLLIFGGGSFMTGISDNLSFMIGSRVIQSIGAAIIIPTSMVIGLEISNRQNRHKIVAALAGVQGLAVALGPSIGGFVSQYFGWRWVFFINVPLVILDLILYPFVLPLKRESKFSVKIDWLGALLSTAMLFSLSLGLIKGNTWGWHSTVIWVLFAIALGSLVIFVLLETYLKSPMIDMTLFKSRNFVGAGSALILCNFFLGGMAILIPTFLTQVQGESELRAALLITPYSIAVMFSAILTSLFVKRINNKLLISAGFILIGISYLLLSQMNLRHNYNELIVAAILLGVGYGLVAATANILAVADFHGSRLTDSQSVANVLRQVGMVLSIAIFMTILANNVGTAKQKTLGFSDQQINALSLSTAQQARLRHKLQYKLNPQNNDVSENQKARVTFQPIHVSNKRVAQLSKKLYQKRLRQMQREGRLSSNHIVAISQKLKHLVYYQVQQSIKHRVIELATKIKILVSQIKWYLKAKLNHAFLDIYGDMLWLAFLSLLIIPIFKFKPRS